MASQYYFLWFPLLAIRLSYTERTCCGSNYSSFATEPSCSIDSASSSGGGGSSNDAVSPVFFQEPLGVPPVFGLHGRNRKEIKAVVSRCVVSLATPQTSIGLGLAGGVVIAAFLIFLGVLYARRQRKERGLPSKRDRCGGEDLSVYNTCFIGSMSTRGYHKPTPSLIFSTP